VAVCGCCCGKTEELLSDVEAILKRYQKPIFRRATALGFILKAIRLCRNCAGCHGCR